MTWCHQLSQHANKKIETSKLEAGRVKREFWGDVLCIVLQRIKSLHLKIVQISVQRILWATIFKFKCNHIDKWKQLQSIIVKLSLWSHWCFCHWKSERHHHVHNSMNRVYSTIMSVAPCKTSILTSSKLYHDYIVYIQYVGNWSRSIWKGIIPWTPHAPKTCFSPLRTCIRKEGGRRGSGWGGGGKNWSGGSCRHVSRWKPSGVVDFTSRLYKLSIWERAKKTEGGTGEDVGGW